ncbi:MAG TPA: Hsp33 family molecular chaperone HslO [Burkholderiaceae bacterium]|nr:Hsp33 family molecular chaperone HslO [Burkholderiaceae bacterium]
MADVLRRFLLQGAAVRGEIVSLTAAWQAIVARNPIAAPVRDRLGELCAAALLLSASLKFDGALVLQIHGDGPVALLVVECGSDAAFRATVTLREGARIEPGASIGELVNAGGNGRFVVTLDPRDRSSGQQPYQGIVPFEGETVGELLERYMQRSEQVPTRLWLAADGERAVGLLLQRLASDGGRGAADADGWNRMQALADTITRDELLSLQPDQVLKRLFWQEPLHAFDSRQPRFECRCSRAKVAGMLRALGRSEAESIVADEGAIRVTCEFCNTVYEFDAIDSARLFLSELEPPGSPARH